MNNKCEKCGHKLIKEWIQITDEFDVHWVCLKCRKDKK